MLDITKHFRENDKGLVIEGKAMGNNFTDASIAAAASKSTYTGAGLTVTGWLVSSEAAILVGMILGVLGLIVNFAFRFKQDRREEREHQERMKKLKE